MTISAVIGKIIELKPIDGADNIVSATVVCGEHGKWRGVVNKKDFKVDDLCEVFLQDCLLPKIERFAFMEKNNYLIKMRRFKGAPSEVLIMPYCYASTLNKLEIGEDISGLYGCIKYEKPMPAKLSGIALGNFPSFIPKTDEPNFQRSRHLIAALTGKSYYVTEKADGSSATVYKYNGHFGCCTRNLELREDDNNAIWKIARKYDLEKLLPDGYALQFEVIGEGIQKNPMGIKGVEPRLFNIYDINKHEYIYPFDNQYQWTCNIMPFAKLLDSGQSFGTPSDDTLLKAAEGFYDSGKPREGIVIRSQENIIVDGERLSFKVINLNYK